MYNTEIKTVEKIRENYIEKKPTQIDELKKLHEKVERPAQILAYSLGSISALILGTGMSLAMKVIGTSLSFALPLGIAVGVVGLVGITANYFIYKKFLSMRKNKYANKVLALSDEILNNQTI